MRIGILTGGGDVPGLNPCIRAFVYRAEDEGHEVLGIRRGWAGLLHINPDNPQTLEPNCLPLNKLNTRRRTDRRHFSAHQPNQSCQRKTSRSSRFPEG